MGVSITACWAVHVGVSITACWAVHVGVRITACWAVHVGVRITACWAVHVGVRINVTRNHCSYWQIADCDHVAKLSAADCGRQFTVMAYFYVDSRGLAPD